MRSIPKIPSFCHQKLRWPAEHPQNFVDCSFKIVLPCSVFIAHPSVLQAGLPDVMEYWTLREYVELVLLRTASNSARRESLQAVRERVSEQEALEACAFAFGSMDGDEDSLRGVTLECKPFNVFGMSCWKSQLQLIDSSYREQSDHVLEILKLCS